ncbi:MAG: NADPH:quinone reductase [Fimbriiglobus sp.]
MKAAYFDRTGGPEVIQIGDLPTPEPGPGQVRVKVVATSVNPIDTYVRAGATNPTVPAATIPGRDFAGVVDAVGPGVTGVAVGDRVWGTNQGSGGRPGTFAEFTTCGEEWVYPLPAGVGFQDAAAVALVGVTAHLGLFLRAGLAAGEWVFVNGGAGGVGSMVVQMAKATGAKVIATAGSDEKVSLVRGLGADVVVNYKTADVAAAVKAATSEVGVNVWFETVPPTDLDRTVELMAPRGRIVVMAGRQARPAFPNGAFYVKGLTMVGFAMFNSTAAELRACAVDINRWLADGAVKPHIGAVLPLAETSEAHRLQEANTLHHAGTLTGKIVVTVG